MRSPSTRPVPWWAVVSAGGAPVMLIGGWTLAQAKQPSSYDPVRDTISALAGLGATDRLVMTSALACLGACHVITAAGLRPARAAGRAVLAGGGVATMLVAAFPQPVEGESVAHTVAAATAFIALGAWPALASAPFDQAPLLTTRACSIATAALLGLVVWFAVELHGGQRGLAERAAAGAQALWPLAVVATSRRWGFGSGALEGRPDFGGRPLHAPVGSSICRIRSAMARRSS
ncbi:MAG: DUF998 domain-containing protein [Acidimicrobiales bacterium]